MDIMDKIIIITTIITMGISITIYMIESLKAVLMEKKRKRLSLDASECFDI